MRHYTGPKRNTWTYDAHGNVTADPQAWLGIEWYVTGLPRTITASAGTGTASTQRSYLAGGTLTPVSDGTSTRLYLGDMYFITCTAFLADSGPLIRHLQTLLRLRDILIQVLGSRGRAVHKIYSGLTHLL